MPTANRGRFITCAVGCFLSQDYPDLELVILDDGEEEILHLLPVDSRIRYSRVAPRLPVGTKRNICCEMATGEVIAHFDDDDWSAPDRVRRQVGDLLANPGKQLTGFFTLLFWDMEKQQGWRYRNQNYACGTSQVYWRAWWEKNRFSNRSLGEDSDFNFRAKRAGVLHPVEGGKLLVARIHPGRTSTSGVNGSQYHPVPREEFPEGFLRAI